MFQLGPAVHNDALSALRHGVLGLYLALVRVRVELSKVICDEDDTTTITTITTTTITTTTTTTC